MDNRFDVYLRQLRETPLDEHTEHTGRSALEALLKAFASEAEARGVSVQHEPKREPGKGAPDFLIRRAGQILGYVEVKKADGSDLDKVRKSDQIKRYRTLSDNIILTDYLQFIWIGPDGDPKTGIRGRATLAYASDFEGRTIRTAPERTAETAKLLSAFFSQAPTGIGRAQALALALAARSRLLRDFLAIELARQASEHEKGRLHALYQVFREQIFHELTIKEFADAFAQMLAYGLFLARLNAGEGDVVTLENVRRHIPGSFRLIRELVRFLEEMNEPEYREARWVVDEVLSIVNGLALRSIHEDLSFRQRKAISRKVRAGDEEEHRLFERDPFIYFYEDFLKAYDPATRESRGVYYTPPPIVNFIVRAVDDILKEDFGIRDGLANHKRVTVLDFACGTGTFLLEVCERIFDNIGGSEVGKADRIVREHILKNLFGFEYLIAPYTIAHIKLSQYLRDKGHPLGGNERLQVFLTNTLEPVEPLTNMMLPAIAAEVAAAQEVKEKPILVITGNPPYSGHSKNKGEWIATSIDEYRFTIEADDSGRAVRIPLGERNPKWLNDDYVKFIRFAQMKMDGYTFTSRAPDGKPIQHSVAGVESGVVGIITNHSWLDNPTFRGMRQSLMRSFDQIYVLDLHGSTKRRERAPDGSDDDNVFDIQQGVAISLFVKRSGIERGVWRGDLWGKRLDKYKATSEGTPNSIGRERLSPARPFYLFTRQDAVIRKEYESGWRLTSIFPVNVLGFQTHRDAFSVSFTECEMLSKVAELANASIPTEELARRYGLKSNRDWSLEKARAAAQNGDAIPPSKISYRPFDDRWSEFSNVTMDYPRRELLDHVAGRDNISLLAPRQIGIDVWRHGFVADAPAESCLVSSHTKSQNYVFPAYTFGSAGAKRENLAAEFRSFLDARYEQHYSSEEILGYVYAILHAPSYRSRYADFLRIDFPRVPFFETGESFERLSALGWALVQAHLLRDLPRRGLAEFHGRGDHSVETVRHAAADESVFINTTQSFRPVPETVWNFHIGGYQVLDKYLKSRKGRKLSLAEIEHVAAVADSLAFTIDQMALIDEAYSAAFSERG